MSEPSSQNAPPLNEADHGPDSWSQMMLQAQAGDRTALDLLLRELIPWLFILVRAAGVNEADAWDVVQETALRVWQSLARFDPSLGSARSWVGRIARNLVIDFYRGQSRRRSESLPADIPADGDDPTSAQTERGEERALLRRALGDLKPADRAAIARRLEGLSYEEISDSLQIPIGTAASRVHRGIKGVRARLRRAS